MALALHMPERVARDYGEVASVAPGSAAARAGIASGDWLLSVNGHRLRDVIDFRFYTADDELTLQVRRGAETHAVYLTHGPEDPLGLDINGDGLESIIECKNHCPFCFVTQNPGGLRRSLDVKDDDYRYSFLFSHFVTLTNLSPEEWARIEEQHLSPLYFSVHSTDVQLRRKLLGNRFAEDPLEVIDRLGRAGITVHTQLVTCPGINDGAEMDRSIADLMSRFPQVRSIAAVPVGLTKIRTERTMSRGMPLRKFRPDEAARALEQIAAWQQRNVEAYGIPVIYACDEFYLLAGQEVPPSEHYEDDAQLENGVGLVRQLLDDWRALKRRLPSSLPRPRHLTMACGTLIAPVLQRIVDEMNRIGNLRVDLHVVHNRLFGEEVTCSGLVVGRDLLDTLAGHELGDTLLVSRSMFNVEGALTLDDMTPDDLERATGRPFVMIKRFGEVGDVLGARATMLRPAPEGAWQGPDPEGSAREANAPAPGQSL